MTIVEVLQSTVYFKDIAKSAITFPVLKEKEFCNLFRDIQNLLK